ncbi:MAG: thioredoxin domain-containing protein [Candidatus Saccharibacteria bacterium]
MTQTKIRLQNGAEIMTMIKHTNRLSRESSPFLLQYAHDPVDWMPWSDEAFTKAHREDKPIFLHIGYSTCHMCHVVHREVFASPEAARFINEHFVPVLVDRDERPDIDMIYIEACRAMTGIAGWPLSVILTPSQEPFLALSISRADVENTAEILMEMMGQAVQMWSKRRTDAIDKGRRAADIIREMKHPRRDEQITEELLHCACRQALTDHNHALQGFQGLTTVLLPHQMMFLLNYSQAYHNQDALSAVENMLDTMYRSAVYDHVGSGFMSYPAPSGPLIPSFEKTLQHNAMMAMIYMDAYQAMGNHLFAKIARDVLDYVVRELLSPQGGFYSAQDSEWKETAGLYYAWTWREIESVLGPDASAFGRAYGAIEEDGFNESVILNLNEWQDYGTAAVAFHDELEKLFASRNDRVGLFKDISIYAKWNGLIIAALAQGAVVLDEPRYLELAGKAAEFVLHSLRRLDGRLLTCSRDGEARYAACANDYAYMVWGLLELTQANSHEKYLVHAVELSKDMVKLFWDEEYYGFFFYGKDAEELLRRPRESLDGILPSSNAVAAMNLLRLARFTGQHKFQDWADRMFQALAGSISDDPLGHAFWLCAKLYDMNVPIPEHAPRPVKEKKKDEGGRVDFIEVIPASMSKEKARAGLDGNLIEFPDWQPPSGL